MASSNAALEPSGGGAARRSRPGVEGKRTAGARPRLHGFALEDLSWGNQKLLRCVKVPEAATPRAAAPDGGGRGRPAVEDEDEDDEEELTKIRDKLMAQYKAAVNNIQRAAKKDRRYESVLRAPAPPPAGGAVGGGSGDEKDFGATAGEAAAAAAAASKPWNLRTRRSACSAPAESGQQRRLPNALPPPAAEKGHYLTSAPEPKTDSLARETPKLSLTLTKEEIAEDYRLMSEGCPPKRPRRRPQKLQRVLEKLVPGMWLSEITADDYKVAGEK